MDLFKAFKKKKRPAFDAGLYDWKFEFVKGGMCYLKKLRKPKRVLAVMWVGGLRFKCFWIYVDTADSFKQKVGLPLPKGATFIDFSSEN